ncbi:MAG: hypothetical protein ACOC0O_02685 [Spirochaetota bacterium]
MGRAHRLRDGVRRFVAIAGVDARSVARDDVLQILAWVPPALVAIVRLGEPLLAGALEPGVTLADHHGVILTVLVILTPLVYGWVLGFLLLEARDERSLAAIAITPVSVEGYLAVRVAFLTALSLILTLSLVPLAGLSRFAFARLVPVAGMAALCVPLMALSLAAFAGNKVEGLAIGKFMAVLMIAPILPFYTTSPVAMIAGVIPFYWIGDAIAAMSGPPARYWASVAVGFVVHAVAAGLLLRAFRRRIA